MWYNANDVMIILECGRSYAYHTINLMRNEIANTKIPGTNRHYFAPPSGKIQKSYFCEAMMLSIEECDKIIAEKSKIW